MKNTKREDIDFYIINKDFELLSFNQSVKERYPGIKAGDYCYQATMRRNSPCRHCPIANGTGDYSPTFYDPFYETFIEAAFADIGDGNYAVTCRPSKIDGRSLFYRMRMEGKGADKSSIDYESENVGIIGGYCEDGFPFYYANEKMAKMLGYDNVEELKKGIDAKVANTIYSLDMPEVIKDLGDSYNSGMKYETSYRMQRKDGSLFWTIDRGEVIETPDKRLAIISACLDVTKYVEEEKAREQEAKAISARNKMLSDIIGILYDYSLTVNVNTGSFEVVKGRNRGHVPEMINKISNYNDLLEYFMAYIDDSQIDKAKQFLSLCNYKDKDELNGYIGTEVFVGNMSYGRKYHEINIFHIVDEKGNRFIKILGRDVTDAFEEADSKAQLEIDRALNKAKSSLLFNMSHDIRTPMNAIIGLADLLSKHLDDKELAEDYLDKIVTAGDFLLSLIDNMLEMAKIESGNSELIVEKGNIDQFHESIKELFYSMTKKKKLNFSIESHVSHSNIFCDKAKVHQIFLNILSNSIKYTAEGGTIRLLTEEEKSDKEGYVRFKTVIEDNGIGMSKEYLPHIFEVFSRERNTTESGISGTGLGMSIVKRMVDLMNGSIEVESEVGKGTRITLVLDHRLPETEQDNSMESDGFETIRGKRILIAEDNELNAEIAMALLEENGLVVNRATDGLECLKMIEEAADDYYDLILMDIQMPNMNGYEAAKAIRNLADQKKANIKIIAMTANAFDEDKQNAFDSGMNGHIAKPIHVDKFMIMLKEMLG